MRLTDMLGAGGPNPTPSRTVQRFADRYDIVKTLKQGNGVSTFLAVDSTSAEQVVLKVFDKAAIQAGTHARFLHETRVLRELTGVGVCALHDAGQTDTHLYLTQQYAPGVTLEHALLNGPLSVLATLRTGIAVAAALDLAHCAGVFHRDVKPANIVVDGREPDGTFSSVTLIDFGFARSPWMEQSIRDDLVGTVRYLSPEAAGMLPLQSDERSDLYACGVVLFECLVGRPPFDSASVGDLLRQHLSVPVPELRRTDEAIPAALSAVIHRLLRKDPAERYQSAEAVCADLTQILAAVRGGDPDPSIVIGRHDRRLTLTDPAFVGREAELASLTAMVQTMVQSLAGDPPGVVLLDADSGGGKSRLLSEVAERAAKAGTAVVHGQGVALGGQRPFTLLHGVADGIVELVGDDTERRLALAERLSDVAPAIVRALPALAGLFGSVADADPGPEQFGELRSMLGLQRLLATVTSPERPLLVVLDDCQWSDELTVRLLRELFADPERAPRNLAVIAAFRSEEVPAGHPLRTIKDARTVHLGPLSNRSIGLLAESMAGPLPDEAVDTVVRLADGNPFMATAVLRGLVESEALVAEPDGWSVDPTRLPDAQTARRAAAFLVQRLELIGPRAVHLLSVGAVLGKQFDVVTATRIAGDVIDAGTILADARRRRLLWIDDAAGTCTFAHDKIREALLAGLDPEIRREFHGLAAEALMAAAADDASDELAFDLAYHLDEAGRPAEALPFAVTAAELARDRYALDVAAAHYRMAARAVETSGAADAGTRRRLAEGLGDVLMLQGAYEDAQRQLSTARGLVEVPSHAAAIDGKLGALAFKQGDIPTAKHHLEGALRLLGRRVPGRVLLLPFLLWELAVQAVHSLLPRLTTGRRSTLGHDEDFLAMRMYSRLAYVYWFHSGKATCAWAHLRGMNLAERYEPSTELGQAWSEHAPVMTMLPWYRRGIDYAERSLNIRRELGDLWGQGQSLNFTGVARYAASDFDRAQAACEEAVRLLRRTGDQWEVNTASWNLALCLLRKGQLRQTVDVAVDTFETAQGIGDRTAAGISLSIWARATEGRVPAELVRELLDAGSEDVQTTAELHLADALVNRANGDLPRAITCIRRAIRAVQGAGLRQEYIAPIFPWYATMLREHAEATPSHAPGLRAQRLKTAAKAARVAARWARSYRNNVPHAYREVALIASLRGRSRHAFRMLDRSAVASLRNGAAYEQALTQLVRAQLIAVQAGAGTTPEVTAAAAAVDGFDPLLGRAKATEPEAATISIFDRFATLLHAGRSIGAAPTEIALEAAIREAATALLRAERCHLVPFAAVNDKSLTTQSGEDVDGHSRTLLVRAAESGAPVVAMGEAFNSTDSLVLSGIRSALAAPISVNGQIRSFLYVTHRQLGELFGEDEIQVAAFVATLSGAAYEHLLGSETRLRALVQGSSDVITLVDADGVVEYQSAALSTVFGLPTNRLAGLPVSSWVHPDDAGLLERALNAAAGAAGTTMVECRLGHADGSYRFAESAISNLLDEPTVGALVINTRDITDRKLTADQLRVVEDRERIARDLHDVVIQRLFAVGLSLDALSVKLPAPHSMQIVRATDELHQTIRDIRGAIFSLRVDEPNDPLTDRLRAVVARAAEVLGLTPEVEIDEAVDHRVAESLRQNVLAYVNEALSNVARHARAESVIVRVRLEGDDLVASVIDDGIGLPTERTESGLANLRRRAEVAGGSMTTGPGPDGRGLALDWRVPVRET